MLLALPCDASSPPASACAARLAGVAPGSSSTTCRGSSVNENQALGLQVGPAHLHRADLAGPVVLREPRKFAGKPGAGQVDGARLALQGVTATSMVPLRHHVDGVVGAVGGVQAPVRPVAQAESSIDWDRRSTDSPRSWWGLVGVGAAASR
jgi:hypothetical protein